MCIGRIEARGLSVDGVTLAPEQQLTGRRTARLRHGDPGMRRVRLGLFAAGLATFALLYTPQPLLPPIK